MVLPAWTNYTPARQNISNKQSIAEAQKLHLPESAEESVAFHATLVESEATAKENVSWSMQHMDRMHGL